ncbi:hypothetical protein C8Q80DRAFT_1116323 [Daedaleopsis nitida]|nr:hypothetical protein C8Q80DRAFT_1116323 [Daedaleopsis nitida]
MDGSKPGEVGVITWCNSMRFAMARDAGRQFLHEQIQREGFDFLDMYLENFLEGPKKEPVIELLKTPGRKKNAPTRTRAAVTAAVKTQSVISLSFEDGATKENLEPLNDFHKTLLQVKEGTIDTQDTRKPALSRHISDERPRPQVSEPFVKLKNQRIVTIADSPAVNLPEDSTSELRRDPLPAPVFDVVSDVKFPIAAANSSQGSSLEVKTSLKELSIIAEDDELAEKSRASFGGVASNPHHTPIEPAKSNDTVFHDVETQSSQDVDMDLEDANRDVDILTHDLEEPTHEDLTSISTTTFHTISLGPRDQDSEPTSPRTAEFHTAPLPKISLPPVPVEQESHSHIAPLPTNPGQHEEYTMPLRDEPSAPVAVPGLSRKPSVSQFTGLPAPSPLRKSLRAPGEATAGVSIGTTAPPLHAVKRSSTSWLSKARETKALENTTKRTSTLGVGSSTLSANKRKSGEMLDTMKDGPNLPAAVKVQEEEERLVKLQKLSDLQTVFSSDLKGKGKAIHHVLPRDAPTQLSPTPEVIVATSATEQEDDTDMLTTLLKKNYGPRTGKSMGKSLGGNAAAALAEARAQAEARIAERHKIELGIEAGSQDVDMVSEETRNSVEPSALPASPQMQSSIEMERRLSVSDLVPVSQTQEKEKEQLTGNTSISTTPPNSPPRARTVSLNGPPAPVFSKPAPGTGTGTAVPSSFRDAAAPTTIRDFKLPTTNPFSIPAAMALGMGPKLAPLSAQSSKASVFSDIIFDRPDGSSAWMPSTQDTSYSAAESQSQPKVADDNDDLDDDDSWGVDEKFAGHQMWTPFGFTSSNPEQLKDDTMTWSTIPSRSTSQKGGDTGVQTTQSLFASIPETEKVVEEEEPHADRGFAERLADAENQPEDADEGHVEEADIAMEIDEDEVQDEDDLEKDDLEDAILAGKPTIKLVQQPKPEASSQPPRSNSQQSIASSSSSSQSNLGFFGTASKLVSSVLGGGKKTKPEVKSLQLAAAAAKKQQEELEKKAQRLKEMEARRQQALQRKADEEKIRAAEEERKAREEAERRKREREEHTDKRPLRSATTTTTKKTDDDTTKRKLGAPISQKPPSKDRKDTAVPRQVKASAAPGAATTSKPPLKSALKQPATGPSGSSNPVTPGAAKAQKTVKHAPSSSNLKSTVAPSAASKGKERDVSEIQYLQPTRKAPGPPPEEPCVASETIELPDINSEYSDSEDEDRPKRDLPDWAKSPDIAAALQQQSTINPDDIFGRIGSLRMEEIFRTRHSRFRARTSSANWAGTDELTAAEEREYAKRMGFK